MAPLWSLLGLSSSKMKVRQALTTWEPIAQAAEGERAQAFATFARHLRTYGVRAPDVWDTIGSRIDRWVEQQAADAEDALVKPSAAAVVRAIKDFVAQVRASASRPTPI